VRYADGRGPETSLTRHVLDHFGLNAPSELVPLVYDRGLPLPLVAALGVVVQRARHEGDREAADILQAAADELVLGAESVVTRLGMQQTAFPFILSGGIFRSVSWLSDEVSRRLAGLAPGASVRLLEEEPAFGAVQLALAEARGGARIPAYV
jgi:N-acetylglucosamine kinase-like BadF-type ATPase